MQGILYALIPMVAWGSIGFVSNKIGGKPDQQTLGMTIGALLFAFVVWLFVQPKCQYHSGDLELLVVCFGLWGKMVNSVLCNTWVFLWGIHYQVVLN